MLLPREDALLFFKLMPALSVFANQQLNIIKNLQDIEQYKKNFRPAAFETPQFRL